MTEFTKPYPYTPPIFEPEDLDSLKYLADFGYVVIKVFTDEEVEHLRQTFWREASDAFGWQQAEPRTWEVKKELLTLAQRSDCGHFRGWDFSELQMNIYANLRLQNIFAAITGVLSSDLICGFNSLNIFRPHGLNPEWRTIDKGWYHIDNPKPDINMTHPVYTAVVNLQDVSAETGGFVCVPKSHKLFGKAQRDASSMCDYLSLTPYNNFVNSEPNKIVGNKVHTQPILVCTGGKSGCIIIWDPRTVHCSTSSLHTSDRANKGELLRLASFISMVPKSWASEEVLQERRELVKHRQTVGSHVPHLVCVKRRTAAVSVHPDIDCDPAIQRLIG